MPTTVRKTQAPTKKKTANGAVDITAAHSKSVPSIDRTLGGSGTSQVQFDVRAYCQRYGLKQELIPRMTSFGLRTVAEWAAGKALKGAAVLKVSELKRLTSALENLAEPASIGAWLQTPNPAFEGSTPAQLIERGESDRLWRMVHLLESGQPG